MFQPEVKLEFVRRYCPPGRGWHVFVDIDASELGKTGGERTTNEAKARQRAMLEEGEAAIAGMRDLGVTVGGNRKDWFNGISGLLGSVRGPLIRGDRDITAVHPEQKRLIIAEAEGLSSGQPEGKFYKALGQIVIAASEVEAGDFEVSYVIVIHGDKVGAHLEKAKAIQNLGISGLQLMADASEDRWLIGEALPLYPA